MELTKEWIEEAKKKHGKVFKGMVGKDAFVFRTLSRKDHLDIQKAVFPDGMPADPAEIKAEANSIMEDMTLKKVIIWPETLVVEDLGAGVAPTLVPQILVASGFVRVEEPEEL